MQEVPLLSTSWTRSGENTIDLPSARASETSSGKGSKKWQTTVTKSSQEIP